mmetsp:Transcript_1630/g.2851  ORF Transcript_1630/g.2851 Transcript_1630/m.2851 type:complete len:389 (-) Transcript_1630:17-1183(-)
MEQAPMDQQNLHAAAMMQWQYQASMMPPMPPHVPGMPSLPMPWPNHPPMVTQWLTVRVDGLKFEYQLTEDDVRKVFSRYGEVVAVKMDREGTTSQVQFAHPHQAMAAQSDLDEKQLAGMSGAYLTVEFAPTQGYAVPPAPDPQFLQHMAASSFMNPMIPSGPGYPMPTLPPPVATSPAQSAAGQPKKFTCKLEVGIENEGEFRVGSRVIQIARSIWQDPKFQEHGGKTRLRGKGIGGPHEGDEPLALCISCRDQAAFDKAVQYAETQLQKVHTDYKAFCQQHGKPIPELEVKISKKGTFGPEIPAKPSAGGSGSFVGNRGERPAGAPSDEEIERMIEERNDARKAANFKKADEVREHLRQRGVVLMDEKGAKGTFKGNEVTKWRFWRP